MEREGNLAASLGETRFDSALCSLPCTSSGARTFARGVGRRRSSGKNGTGGQRGDDIFWVRGRMKYVWERFLSLLRSARSKGAGNALMKLRCIAKKLDFGECISVKRNAGGPWLLTRRRDPSNEKRHIYRSSINMADELIQQAQELFEGQIVGCTQHQDSVWKTDLVSRISKAKSKRSSYPLSS